MDRMPVTPRSEWRQKVEALGFVFHTAEDAPYWDESACYFFEAQEIDRIEKAAQELFRLCMEAVEHIVRHQRFSQMAIPDDLVPLIMDSWNREHPTIYGRFDLAYDGVGDPKLLEFNADTPTALLEAAVIQWKWLEDSMDADQFNSIHEELIAAWQWMNEQHFHGQTVHFTSLDNVEDEITLGYMLDVAQQAGVITKRLYMQDIGWDRSVQRFVDREGRVIDFLFKLYPWEWLVQDEFFRHVPKCFSKMFWIEPPWKLLLSNKAILPILWELFPGHPNLLEAHFGDTSHLADYVRKPFYSREGANISMYCQGRVFESGGAYGKEGHICQALAPMAEFDGNYPVLGAWIIGDKACGLGIRESDSPITTDLSRFVPHLIAP